MKYFFSIISLITFLSCNKPTSNILETGNYRAILKVQDQQELPFIFKVKENNSIEIYNADEVIEVDEITYKNDSVYIQTPVFEGYITAKIYPNKKLNGYFIKPSLNRIVPFSTETSYKRFDSKNKPNYNITGKWETIFSPNNKNDKYIAKGIFKQEKNKVKGTFRTTTGDYRYLEGVVDGDSLKLSTFDGAHAFLFTAKVNDSSMVGNFYSGNHWKEPFIAKLNNDYELPDENSLTSLKDGYKNFNFSFPNENGELISYSDKQFQNKVVIVQIMGTWCPNCLDESKYYTEYLKKNKNTNLKFVALAFETDKTQEKAFEKIKRLKKRLNITYPILLAQYGSSDKKEAAKKLPMLNHILSYPTTIFIDKKGIVRKIHTGFNGPATGKKYIEFKHEFKNFVNTLLNE
ncbi:MULTISPECIES: peroxiredoxin family protein [unclassified Tenacibaculum]|uniref:peroxiredoxin family protein n=1 Tax=unclassified Tenacibaculum TaxID=2635139 RepID=UPI001F2180C8|nr:MULTISPECIES: TlpA disulfide reductase family protein [unclassified Tenacibaculum]MCF2876413.1 TlpA family protein disulfide reductase [Tenacibaculum sp. Cn5-1]MCF2936444.1 TlpA family protein disulfide reductase [Tenacibaculum sp. Cn5-34]MCG7512831.1 TlpA family protein disulfide reductase [Tenacibaculum sp. Cn5-46]